MKPSRPAASPESRAPSMPMPISWQKVSLAEFASFERILAPHVLDRGGVYWRQVRPFFYRPLLPFQEYGAGSLQPPRLSFLGGYQHAVPPGENSNSHLNLLMFQGAQTYSLESLDYNRKRQVKLAAKKFSIRSIADVNEFKRHAHPVYLSFYQRTRYPYGAQRRRQNHFWRWANALFQTPKALILGGYREDKIGGVSVSFLIADTLYYAMFFCDTESLRLGLSDLMLHSVREAVVQTGCAKRIFAGLYHGGKGVDDFYLLRGCKVVRQPAYMQINPLTEMILKRFMPNQYRRLLGDIPSTFNKDHAALGAPPATGLIAGRIDASDRSNADLDDLPLLGRVPSND